MSANASIVVTVADPRAYSDPDLAARRNELYATAVVRAGGRPVLLDATTDEAARRTALDEMDGLLLSGGTDIEPARYGRPIAGAVDIQRDRDAMEAEAWDVATRRGVPILGICRGMQAINVFAGGTLLQHVDGHAGPAWGHGPAATHAFRPAPGSRLTRILFPTNPRGGAMRVNTYHHQGVRAEDLAPGFVASAWASSPAGDLVEGLEAADGRFIIGVQSHPEKTESTPAGFERLFSVFVDAARGPAGRR